MGATPENTGKWRETPTAVAHAPNLGPSCCSSHVSPGPPIHSCASPLHQCHRMSLHWCCCCPCSCVLQPQQLLLLSPWCAHLSLKVSQVLVHLHQLHGLLCGRLGAAPVRHHIGRGLGALHTAMTVRQEVVNEDC